MICESLLLCSTKETYSPFPFLILLVRTGIRGKIQVSQDTAHLLTMAGKAHWLEARDDSVHAKGKGVLQTYWLIRRSIRSTSKRPSASSNNSSVISTSKDLLSSVLPIASSSPTEQGISEEETRVCSAV